MHGIPVPRYDGRSAAITAATTCGGPREQSAAQPAPKSEERPPQPKVKVFKSPREIGSMLYTAASRGASSEVKRLLASSADMEFRQTDGTTALHAAALRGRDETIGLLLRAGFRTDAVDVCCSTPLHAAAGNQKDGAVRMLLDAGADRAAKDDEGKRAYDLACEAGHTSTVAVFDAHSIIVLQGIALPDSSTTVQ